MSRLARHVIRLFREAPSKRRLLRSLALGGAVLACALLAGACSDDDADDAASQTTTTTAVEERTTTTAAAPAPYADHESEQYAGTANWICHPDLDDTCDDIASTVVSADGGRTVDDASPASDPSFDCFYVYPTTSSDPGPTSDLAVDSSEIDTVRAQVARYSSKCRVFAPAYRQITVPALLGGDATQDDRAIAYGDVVDAWRTYVAEHNDGRGVVLIGHSQGAGHLRRLIEDEIDPTPEVRRLVASAVLLGSGVPADGFEHLPPCASADESGCVVSYASYPGAAAPVDGALFGRDRASDEPALCVNPAELLGTGDQPVEAVLPAQASLLGGIAGFEDVATPFVSLLDAVRLTCTEAGGYAFLGVELAEGDARPLGGLVEQQLGPTWGLHLLDAQLGQDQLIELVARQAEAHSNE